MFKFNKKFPLMVSGLLCSTIVTACGEFEALTPNADLVVLEKGVCEQVKSTDQTSYLSEKLSSVLLESLMSSSEVIFGEQAKTSECPEKAYMESFDKVGDGKVLGVSVMKSQNEGAGSSQVSVKVFSRAASVNREMEFSGQISSQDSAKALVELNKESVGENLDAYLACLGLGHQMEQALRRNEAFDIRSFVSCQDASCDEVLVQLELNNMKSRILNSRIALIFKKDGASITNADGSVELSLVESSLESVGTFTEAELNKKEEVIAPQCVASLNKREEAPAKSESSAATTETIESSAATQSAVTEPGGAYELSNPKVRNALMNGAQSEVIPVEIAGGEKVELDLTNLNQVSEEQNAVMQEAIEKAIDEANEDDGYKVGPQ